MVRTFSLQAAVQPSVDQRQVEREAERTREQFSDQLSGLPIDGETGGVAGAGAGGGGPGVGSAGAAAAAGSRVGASGLAGAAGAAAKAAVPVAAAGTVFFGMSKALDRLAAASPALQAQSAQFSQAMNLFFKPFGDFIASRLDPFVDNLIDMAINFNSAVDGNGLPLATAGLAGEVASALSADGTPRDIIGDVISDLAWSDFVAELDWSAFLKRLAWNSFITNIAWSRYIPGLQWASFIRGIDLASFVEGINLGNFIDIPNILQSGGTPGGSVPGRTPDPPSFDDDDGGGFGDPNPSGRFGGDDDGGGGGGGGFDDPNPPGRFDTGGMVGGTGLAVVDAGERVLPPSQVTDRGEADLAQGDEITRLLRQIRRELARQDSGRDDAVVQELRQLRREVTGGGGRSRLSNRDAVDALERLADRYGADL
jgi:hypothetical protein